LNAPFLLQSNFFDKYLDFIRKYDYLYCIVKDLASRTEMNLDSYIRKDNFLEVVDIQHFTPPHTDF
jgi:hypothetical protein